MRGGSCVVLRDSEGAIWSFNYMPPLRLSRNLHMTLNSVQIINSQLNGRERSVQDQMVIIYDSYSL